MLGTQLNDQRRGNDLRNVCRVSGAHHRQDAVVIGFFLRQIRLRRDQQGVDRDKLLIDQRIALRRVHEIVRGLVLSDRAFPGLDLLRQLIHAVGQPLRCLARGRDLGIDLVFGVGVGQRVGDQGGLGGVTRGERHGD